MTVPPEEKAKSSKAALRRPGRRKKSKSRHKSRPRASRATLETLEHFFERAESIILDDLMMTCPDAELGRRMIKPWLDDLRWQNKLAHEKGVMPRVVKAIESGAKTLGQIRGETGLLPSQVDRAVRKLVRDGAYFWIRQGGEPEFTKGSRPLILHKTGEPYGT